MAPSIELGSIIGGRYKVTGIVISTAEGDDILSGLDQVLNRNVSILVAAKKNASQASQSGRELATGERQSNIQVLDMVMTDGRPALVTNPSKANDLLDLLVSQEAPYVEPFFTESLGSEIFGQKRDSTPVADDDWDESYYDLEEKKPLIDLTSMTEKARARSLERAAARDAAASRRAEEQRLANTQRELQEREQERTSNAYSEQTRSHSALSGAEEITATAAVTKVPPRHEHLEDRSVPVNGASSANEQRAAVRPLPGNFSEQRFAASDSPLPEDSEYESDPAPRRGGVFSRILVGALLGVMLLGAVFLAVTQLGGLFSQNDSASKPSAASSPSAPSPSAQTPGAEPKIAKVTRLVPSNPNLDAGSDGNLGRIIDGNPQSVWGSLVYTNPQFGNLTENFALVMELESPSEVNRLTLNQRYGQGGSYQILVNDSPSLDGASTVGEGTFSSETVNVDLKKEGPKKYVILNVTELPRLSGVQTIYPWGMFISEITLK